MASDSPRVRGQYEILEKIGEGGMGAVYKVRHRLLGDLRVIKTLRPHLVSDDRLRRRFEKEARWATRLQHPNLARLYDYAVDEDGTSFIVLELIRGRTLHDLLEHGDPFPLELGIELGRQALRALGHLHRHRVVHRDISPDNLMLCRDVDGRPELKLIDLGLAKTLETDESLTEQGHFVGKLKYAAPEVLADSRTAKVGPWTDLYALALVMYEVLTGRFPIRGDGPSSLIAGHLFRAPIPFEESDPHGRVSEPLRAWLLRGLAKKPAERFPSAEEMTTALESAAPRTDADDPAVRSWLRILDAAPTAATVQAPRDDGSTQSRIDRRFVEATVRDPGAGRLDSDGATVPLAGADLEEARRQTRLARATSDVEDSIRRGDLGNARVRVEAALEDDPGDPTLRELADRIEEIARVAFRTRVQALVREARSLVSTGNLEDAAAALESARELLPADRQVAGLLDEVRRQQRAVEEERERRRAMQRRVERIDERLRAGDLGQAREALREASEAFRDVSGWETEGRRLSELESEVLRREVGLRMARARKHLEAREADAALNCLEGVLELDPTHEEAERVRRRLLASREPGRDGLVETFERAVASEDFAAAHDALSSLSLRDPRLADELRARLEAAREEVESEVQLAAELGALLSGGSPEAVSMTSGERRRADALLERARHRAGVEDWAAASLLLDQVREIVPDHPGLADLEDRLRAIERARKREQHEARAFGVAVGQIREHLSAGRAAQAARELELAVKRFGDRSELRDLRWKAAEARLEVDSSLDAVRNLPESVVERVIEKSGVDSVGMAVAQIEGLRRAGRTDDARLALARARSHFGDSAALRRVALALDRPEPPKVPPPRPAGDDVPDLLSASSVRTSRRGRSAPRSGVPVGGVLLAVLVIAASAFLGVWQGRRSAEADHSRSGEVVLRHDSAGDGGRLVAVTDEEGFEVAVPPTARELPATLELDPGPYVVLVDPDGGGPEASREVAVTVSPGSRVTVVLAADGRVVDTAVEALP